MRLGLKVFLGVILIICCGVAFSAEEQAPPVEQPADEELISLNLTDQVSLRALLDYVQKQTGKSFVFDALPASETVTILPGRKISRKSLFTLFESVLAIKGYVMRPTTGDWIEIRKMSGIARKPLPILTPDDLRQLPETDAVLTVAYPLAHVSTNEILPAVQSLAYAAETVITLPRPNILLMTDYATNLRQLVTIVSLIDSGENFPSWKIIPLEYANAESLGVQFVRWLREDARLSGADQAQQTAYVDFDIGTNSLIVFAVPAKMKEIETIIAGLDIEPVSGSRNIAIFPLKNSKALDLEKTLQQLTDYQPPSGVSAVPGARQPRAAVRPQEAGMSAVKVLGDETSNSIIVFGPPEVQKDIANLIRELDGRKAQVFLEALVVQVVAGKDTDVGVELASWGGDAEDGGIGVTSFEYSDYDFETGVRTILPGQGLASAVIHDDQIPALLKALQTDNDGRVVSRPRILVNDHKEALFESLDEQPYTTLSSVTSTTSAVSFQGYAEAGTKLKIIPHIGEGGYLVLEMELEISQFTGTASSDSVPPPKRSDTLKSFVTVPDDSTIVIGGLSGYHKTTTVRKVPVLGDIPVFGRLFQREITIQDDSTEYVFIKAQIANQESFEDLKALSEAPIAESEAIQEDIQREESGSVD